MLETNKERVTKTTRQANRAGQCVVNAKPRKRENNTEDTHRVCLVWMAVDGVAPRGLGQGAGVAARLCHGPW